MAGATTLDSLKLYDRESRPWPCPRLTSASIVGHTTDTSTRIWVRVWEKGTYCLVVSEQPIDVNTVPSAAGRNKVRLKTRSSQKTVILPCFLHRASIDLDTDLTHVFDVPDLKPGTRYQYAAFRSDGNRREKWEIGRDRSRSFKT